MGPPETSPEAQATAGILLAGRCLRDIREASASVGAFFFGALIGG
jgi:hypothetical protein